jgi:hypothetical protein
MASPSRDSASAEAIATAPEPRMQTSKADIAEL